MNVHVSYKTAKSPDVEREINQQIQKLQKRLQVFRPELVHLYGTVEENSKREGVVVSLNLRLPSGQIAAQEKNGKAVSAVKGAFSDLLEQLSKHKDHLRAQHKWPRHRRVGRTRPMPQVPFEDTVAAVRPATVSEGDITSWVSANLVQLQAFVERELRYREANGELQADQVAPEEVIDEVIANALGDGEERPEQLALDRWLYRLAMRAIPRLARANAGSDSGVPLERSARRPNVRGSDEPHLQYHQPDEMLLQAEVIADSRTSTPEDIAASDEMVDLVEAALLSAPREQREGFILYAIEGFTVDEIAATTDRKPEEVRQAIAGARNHLQKTLPVSNPFKAKLLQHSKIA